MFLNKKGNVRHEKTFSQNLFGNKYTKKIIKESYIFCRDIFVQQFFKFIQRVAELVMPKGILFFMWSLG